MGRPRAKRKDLPLGVYWYKGRFFCKPTNSEMREIFRAKFGTRKSIPLGDEPNTMRKQWAQLFILPFPLNDAVEGTVAEIMDRYAREVWPRTHPSTRKTEEIFAKSLRKAFGEKRYAKTEFDSVRGDYIRTLHINEYLRNGEGENRAVAANKEIALMSKIFRKAKGWGLTEYNPCLQAEKNIEVPREVYIDDDTFIKIYAAASPTLQCMMDLAQMTGARPGDIRKIMDSDVLSEGILVVPGKAKRGQARKKQLFLWTTDLREVVNRARGIRDRIHNCKGVRSIYLFITPRSAPYSKDALVRLWARTVERVGFTRRDFHFHDIRAKTASDVHEQGGNATDHLGHLDPRTTRRVYQRKPIKVTPLDRVSKKLTSDSEGKEFSNSVENSKIFQPTGDSK